MLLTDITKKQGESLQTNQWLMENASGNKHLSSTFDLNNPQNRRQKRIVAKLAKQAAAQGKR